MDRENRRLSRIENFFSMALTKAKVSDNVFVGELPPTTGKDWEDFVNVDVGQQTDYIAFSSGYVNVYLYARPKGTPLRKNVKRLDEMEAALDKMVRESCDDNFVISELYRDSGYDTERQFHYVIVSISVVAK